MTDPKSRDQATIRCDALCKAITLMLHDHATDSEIAELLRPESPEMVTRVLMRLSPNVRKAVKTLLNEKAFQE
jgi:hypothetical protein